LVTTLKPRIFAVTALPQSAVEVAVSAAIADHRRRHACHYRNSLRRSRSTLGIETAAHGDQGPWLQRKAHADFVVAASLCRGVGRIAPGHGDRAPWLQRSVNRIDFFVHNCKPSIVLPEFKKQWPRRPPRLGRFFDTTRRFYFVTFNTYKRRSFLVQPEVHETFCIFCSKAQQHNVAVGRYVIMPDHVHLFVAFPADGIALPNWVQSLRTVIGKRLLDLGFEKPHWQEGFFDHLLRSYESYAQKWEYVRMNPVRAQLCQTAEAWPYQGEIVPIPFA
jgi:putative transposase